MAGIVDTAVQRSPALDRLLQDYVSQRLAIAGLSLRPDDVQRLLNHENGVAAREALDQTLLTLARAAQTRLEPPTELQWQPYVPTDFGSVVDDCVESAIVETAADESRAVMPETSVEMTPATTAPEALVPTAESIEPPPAPLPPVIATGPLANGTAGVAYDQPVLSRFPKLGGYRIASMSVPVESGLQFDVGSGRLQGVPLAPPGQTLELQFEAQLEAAHGEPMPAARLQAQLLINPHPRSLWKQIEPDAALPFAKPHTRCAELPGAGLRTVAASVRGRSHAHSGSFREDDFSLRHDASGGWTVVAVSDGAGSAKLSRRGSQLACDISSASLHESLAGLDVPAATATEQPGNADLLLAAFREPLSKAVLAAVGAIKAEASSQQCDEKDFAATLLLAAVRPHGAGFFVASFWIGDGAIALFDPQHPSVNLLGAADAGEYSGQTRFLLSAEFGAEPAEMQARIDRRLRCTWAPRGSILALMSDGVSDPKFGTDNALRNAGRWQAWWNELAGEVNLAADNAALPDELSRYLEFWSQGEHDDRTLALVFAS